MLELGLGLAILSTISALELVGCVALPALVRFGRRP